MYLLQVAEAMRHGTAVVASPIAAEGMGLRHNDNCAIAQTAQEFAHLTFKLLMDCTYTDRIAKRAYKTVEENFSIKNARQALQNTFSAIHQKKTKERCQGMFYYE